MRRAPEGSLPLTVGTLGPRGGHEAQDSQAGGWACSPNAVQAGITLPDALSGSLGFLWGSSGGAPRGPWRSGSSQRGGGGAGGRPGPSGPQLISGRGDQVSAVPFHSRKALTGSCLTPSFRNWVLAASGAGRVPGRAVARLQASHRGASTPCLQPPSGDAGAAATPAPGGRPAPHPGPAPGTWTPVWALLPITHRLGSSGPRTGQQVRQPSQPSGPTRAHPPRGSQGRAGGPGEGPSQPGLPGRAALSSLPSPGARHGGASGPGSHRPGVCPWEPQGALPPHLPGCGETPAGGTEG